MCVCICVYVCIYADIDSRSLDLCNCIHIYIIVHMSSGVYNVLAQAGLPRDMSEPKGRPHRAGAAHRLL